jgi:hypothetical protein
VRDSRPRLAHCEPGLCRLGGASRLGGVTGSESDLVLEPVVVDGVVRGLPVQLCHLLEQLLALVHVTFLLDRAPEHAVFAAGEQHTDHEVHTIELARGEREFVATRLYEVAPVLHDHGCARCAQACQEACDAAVAAAFTPGDGLDHCLRVDVAPELCSVAHVDEPLVSGVYGTAVDDQGLSFVGVHCFLNSGRVRLLAARGGS